MLNFRVVFLGNLLFAAFFPGSCFLQASIRESGGDPTIAITVETVNSGGTRLSDGGGLLRIDSNVGGIAGDLSRSVPEPAQFTSKNGYLGQLFDLTGLVIGLTPATVNEEGSVQLEVAAAFDDDTQLPLDPSDVDWNVQSGPIISILESGLLNADTVESVSMPAVIAAAYLGTDGTLNITVLNVEDGSFTGDGLPDAWQIMFFLPFDDNTGPDDDADGDGLSNFYEYAFNFNPITTDSGSSRQPPPDIFTDTGPTSQSPKSSINTTVGDEQFLALTFRKRPDSAGLDYIVEVASTPTASAWEAMTTLVGPPVGPDEDGMFTVTYRDNIPFSASSARFIRIRVVKF